MENLMMMIAIPFGLMVGSSLNALIYRLKNGMNYISGRSECVHCQKKLKWVELIPLFSFLVQKGKCRTCLKKIPKDYFAVEFITSLLFFYSAFIFNANHFLIVFSWFLISASIVIFVYDLKYMLIEDRLTIPVMAVILFFYFIFSPGIVLTNLLVGFLIALFFIVQIIATKGRGVGGGDIRLGFIMGLLLGWNAVYALFFAYILALLWILPLLLVKKVTMKSKIPLGPFLITGMLIFFFHGDFLIEFLQKTLIL